MGAAGNERNVGTCVREPSAEKAADAAGAHHCNLHGAQRRTRRTQLIAKLHGKQAVSERFPSGHDEVRRLIEAHTANACY
jgi:hypothetical protein